MARDTYAFSNGIYNDWHRQYDGIAMIDIDSVLRYANFATNLWL
jgi:hypothetical protein